MFDFDISITPPEFLKIKSAPQKNYFYVTSIGGALNKENM